MRITNMNITDSIEQKYWVSITPFKALTKYFSKEMLSYGYRIVQKTSTPKHCEPLYI